MFIEDICFVTRFVEQNKSPEVDNFWQVLFEMNGFKNSGHTFDLEQFFIEVAHQDFDVISSGNIFHATKLGEEERKKCQKK